MLEAFRSAYELLIAAIREQLQMLLNYHQDTLEQVINLLKMNNKTIHCVGVGRSGLAARIVGECLKNLGYIVSFVGDTLAKPVRKGDIILAISGSGWSETVILAVRIGIKQKAKIIAFTATPGSLLDRLADFTIYLPGKTRIEETPYLVRRMLGVHKTPIAPMGTVNEVASVIFGIALVNALRASNDELKVFRNTAENLLHIAQENLAEIISKQSEKLNRFIEILMTSKKENNKIYMAGAGICEFVANMALMRFLHLGLQPVGLDEWRFRKKNDIFIGISGSGENIIVRSFAEVAKNEQLQVIGITGNAESSLAKMANLFFILRDPALRVPLVQLRDEGMTFIPAFEVSVLFLFESIVAELASRLGIREEEMKARHANIP